MKEWERKTLSAVIVGVGYVLSPLSWWNDLYVNVPIAYFIATLVSHEYPSMFTSVFAGAYWFTNVLGLVLMQIGGRNVLGKTAIKLDRRGVLTWLAWLLIYTLVIVLLCRLDLVRPLQEYIEQR